MSSYAIGLALGTAVAQAQQAAEAAKAEMEYVRAMPEDQQAAYWTQKEKRAEIDRQERAVRALEELARQGRYPVASGGGGMGFVFGLALGSTL